MNMQELRGDINNMVGRIVEVEGCFILEVNRDGYLIDSFDVRDCIDMAVKIDVPDLKKIMLAQVPPWGGSKYGYADDGVIRGRLEKCEDGMFAYCLRDVTSLVIIRPDEGTYTAI